MNDALIILQAMIAVVENWEQDYTMCIVLDETYIGTGQRSNQLNITVYITMVLQPVLVHCTCDSRQSVGQKNTVQV